MKFRCLFDKSFFLLNMLALAVAASSPVIQNDLKTCDSDINSFTSACNSWDGSLSGALAVQRAFEEVDKCIKQLCQDVSASGVQTEADEQTIINYINNTLEPDLRAALNCYIRRKADFQKDGLSSAVRNDLLSLKSDIDQCIPTLVAKAPADKQAAVKSAGSKLDADLQSAINAS